MRTKIRRALSIVGRMGLAAISAALAQLPENSHLWSYTINGFDKTDYLTRTLFPRVAGHRLLFLHKIHRPDADPHLHNHPWETARFLILTGGYWEERLVNGVVESRCLLPGSINELDATSFHRITTLLGSNVWTLGLVGKRVQDWGFLTETGVIPSEQYFAQKCHSQNGGLS